MAAVAAGAAVIAGIVLLDPALKGQRQGAAGDFWDGIGADTVEPAVEPEPEPEPAEIPPGWHPDPHGGHEMRWWDGISWSANVSDGGVASTDPEDS